MKKIRGGAANPVGTLQLLWLQSKRANARPFHEPPHPKMPEISSCAKGGEVMILQTCFYLVSRVMTISGRVTAVDVNSGFCSRHFG